MLIPEEYLKQTVKRTDAAKQPNQSQDPYKTPEAKEINIGNARNEIDPPPLHERQFAVGVSEAGAKIEKEDPADEKIKSLEDL